MEVFDLMSHFRLQYFILQFLCILLCIPKKQWKLLILTSIAAMVNLSLIIPFYLPNVNTATSTYQKPRQTLSILLINVNSSNDKYIDTANYIKNENPDILALEEINSEWLAALSKTLKDYPYRKYIPRSDNFGIGLYSKIAPDEMSIQYYGSAEVPSVRAEIIFENTPVTLLFTHPVPPISLDYFRMRNEQLDDITSHRSKFQESLILIGDLNTTSWSYYYQNFIKKMKLVDTRKGFGLQTTWPTMIPALSITIDHILVSDDFVVLERKVGNHIGSDHKPVYVKLGI